MFIEVKLKDSEELIMVNIMKIKKIEISSRYETTIVFEPILDQEEDYIYIKNPYDEVKDMIAEIIKKPNVPMFE